MTPTAKAPIAPQPVINDVAGPTSMPAPNLVDSIPVHNPGQAPARHDDDAELDKIMQDVGRELHKDDGPHKKHHFWEAGRRHKKEANFSTQMSIKKAPQPVAAGPRPAPAAHQAGAVPKPPVPKAPTQTAHSKVKPIAQKAARAPKAPKQHHAPLMVTVITVLVTVALIAVAYRAYN